MLSQRLLAAPRRSSARVIRRLISRYGEVALFHGISLGESWGARMSLTDYGKRRRSRVTVAKHKRGDATTRHQPGRAVVQRLVRVLIENDGYIAMCRSKRRAETDAARRAESSTRGIGGALENSLPLANTD